jgi:hypothetical protein
VECQPADGDLLDPVSTAGDKRADPKKTVVTVLESREGLEVGEPPFPGCLTGKRDVGYLIAQWFVNPSLET